MSGRTGWKAAEPSLPSITDRIWHERDWPIAKAHLGCAFEIRRDLERSPS